MEAVHWPCGLIESDVLFFFVRLCLRWPRPTLAGWTTAKFRSKLFLIGSWSCGDQIPDAVLPPHFKWAQVKQFLPLVRWLGKEPEAPIVVHSKRLNIDRFWQNNCVIFFAVLVTTIQVCCVVVKRQSRVSEVRRRREGKFKITYCSIINVRA